MFNKTMHGITEKREEITSRPGLGRLPFEGEEERGPEKVESKSSGCGAARDWDRMARRGEGEWAFKRFMTLL
jgi:hypothetical protein